MSIEKLNEEINSLDQQIDKIRIAANDKIKKLKEKRDKLSQQKNQAWLKSFDEIGLDAIPSEFIGISKGVF
jgi:lipid II:glycine glycyltransferase (peptidoglycan interpeptide bridge formation enzyme)